MHFRVFLLAASAVGCLAVAQSADNPPDSNSQTIRLTVPAAVPLRVYLTKRLTKRVGEPVEAKLLEPLYSFDKLVAPAGSQVLGTVTRIESVGKMKRASAILGGDFTPLHDAEVEFTTLILPDGHKIPIQTVDTTGLNTIVPSHPRKPRVSAQNPNGGVLGTGKQKAQEQIDAAKDKLQNIGDIVRGPDKKEYVEDFLIKKLPYHPQWVRKGTRFDAELRQPLDFGTETLKNDSLRLLGTQPAPDSVVHVRLLTKLDSRTTKTGEKVQAILSAPLFSTDRKLILPEGTQLAGVVTVAQRARWFHRGGQLRFRFQDVALPQGVVRPVPEAEKPTTRTDAVVADTESAGSGQVKVDQEGTVTAKESKTRFIAPAISVLIANRAADNDADKAGHLGGNSNVGGRTLGGASGFGLLGAAAAQSSRTVGTVFGFYGMGWSVYSNIISRGSEVEFGRNAAMDIRFGGRAPAEASKLHVSAMLSDHPGN